MNSKFYIVFSVIWLCAVQEAIAQDSLVLGDCIRMAEKRSPVLSVARLSALRSQIELNASKYYLVPSLGATAGYNLNFGRRVDPFTNLFTTNTVQYNTYGLNVSLNVFSGFRNRMEVRANELLYEASRNYLESAGQQVHLEVINAYYACWDLELQRQLIRAKIADLRRQKDRVTSLLHEGRLSAIDSLNALTREELAGVELLNLDRQYETAFSQLAVAVGAEDLVLKFPDLQVHPEIPDFSRLGTNELRQARKELAALQLRKRQARGTYLPTLSAFGTIGTGYSSNNLDYTSGIPQPIAYRDQLRQNFFQSAGISLQVPIYARGENRKLEQLAGIAILQKQEENRLLDLEIRKQQRELQVAYAQVKLEAEVLLRVSERLEKTYAAGQLLYEQGRISSFDLDNLRSEHFEAQLEYLRAVLALNRLFEIAERTAVNSGVGASSM